MALYHMTPHHMTLHYTTLHCASQGRASQCVPAVRSPCAVPNLTPRSVSVGWQRQSPGICARTGDGRRHTIICKRIAGRSANCEKCEGCEQICNAAVVKCEEMRDWYGG